MPDYGVINDRSPHIVADLCEIIALFENTPISRGDIESFVTAKGGEGLFRELDAANEGAPQGLSYGQRQSEQMVNKGLSVAAKYIKFRGFVRLDELEVTGSPLVMFHPRSS